MTTIFVAYLKEINRAYLNGDATEHTHRPALKNFVEALGKTISVTNEPKRRTDCGMPDMKIARRIRQTEEAFGYIECKDIGVDLKREEKGEQLKRYLAAIDNLILTDYIHFRFYRSGQLVETAVLAKEGKGGKFITTDDSIKDVQKLFAMFFVSEPVSVSSAKELAQKMAGIAQYMRDVIGRTFHKESEKGPLHGQYEAFKKVLLHDLQEDEFADMYAQTISYGLFTARYYQTGPQPFTRLGAPQWLPKTNPFLRKTFGHIAGYELDERIAWIVDDLAAVLDTVEMAKIKQDFGHASGKQDPVVHFYETFLVAYDPKLRESRGVYYTPEPVVSYIVRSVDWLLKEKFGLSKGLADNKKIKIQREKGKGQNCGSGCAAEEKIDSSPRKGVRNDTMGPKQDASATLVHRCLVLDPAAGTGTFLYEVIKQIRKTIRDKGAWSAYVQEHLLPRLFGFELMMAPYAVCHMKLGLELAETGYDFASDERLGVFLTNTLEEAEDITGLLPFGQWISEEAQEANTVKRDLPIMVVLGNPPYSGHSANASWKLNEKGKKVKNFIGNLVDDYYFVDGKPLGEKNPKWLQDDYVKFIRYGQHRIEETGSGILAFITNHGYLDNPTFRGMRQQLMKTFSEIYILDLHGNSKKKEICPDGSPDKNVFDIQQGVSIGIFVKTPSSPPPPSGVLPLDRGRAIDSLQGESLKKPKQDASATMGESFTEAKVYHAELWGERNKKYEWLNEHEIIKTKWTKIEPEKPHYLFQYKNKELSKVYETYHKITDIIPKNSLGLATARDNFTIDFDENDIWNRINEFKELSIEEARSKFNLGKDVRDWKIEYAQKDIQKSGPSKELLKPILYRPFDYRFTYYTGTTKGFMCMPRREIMQHILNRRNILLSTTRGYEIEGGWEHVFCSREIIQLHTVSIKEVNYLLPLYLYPTEKKQGLFGDGGGDWPAGREGRVPNLDKGFVDAVCEATGLEFVSDGCGTFLDSRLRGNDTCGNGCAAVKKTPSPLSRYSPLAGGDLKSGRDNVAEASCFGIKLKPSKKSDAGSIGHITTFGPEDVFAWIYGVFHSPQYRERYAEFLKIDFPRVPLPNNKQQFANVCAIGHELVGLHLMEADMLENADLQPRFCVEGDREVAAGHPKFEGKGEKEKGKSEDALRAGDSDTPSPLRGTPPSQGESFFIPKRDASATLGRVWINEKQYFEGVREDVWQFMIGGYQVCEKWLKDRRGRKLSFDDIEHYKKICAALGETIRLMADERLAIFG